MPDTLETSQHFIFVCVISYPFRLLNRVPPQDTGVLLLCVLFLTKHHLIHPDLSKQCVSTFILSKESRKTLMCAGSIDTVVLWDWIISLPREWQYVSAHSHTHLCNSYDDLSQIWKTSWTPVKVAYLFCRYVNSDSKLSDPHLNIHRYWVITVVPYLLYAFVNNHSLETCQRIYKVCPTSDA